MTGFSESFILNIFASQEVVEFILVGVFISQISKDNPCLLCATFSPLQSTPASHGSHEVPSYCSSRLSACD